MHRYNISRCSGRKLFQRQQHISLASQRRLISKTSGLANIGKEDVTKAGAPLTIKSPLPLWQRLGPLSKAFLGYARVQQARPYTTQVVSAIVVYFCGDLGAQIVGKEDYDPWRTTRNMIIGAVIAVPAYRWFMYLGQSFNYTSKVLSLSTKVVVNQIVFTPIFLSSFFSMQTLLSGRGPLEAWDRIKRTLAPSYINSLKLWPAVTAFSFAYIMPQYRALFAGGIAIFWQAYLSWLNERAATQELAIDA